MPRLFRVTAVAAAVAFLEQAGPPLRQHPLRIPVRPRVRLPDGRAPQLGLAARDLAPDARERRLERALAEARQVVVRAPEEVVVAEVQVWLAVRLPAATTAVLGRVGAEDAAAREQQVDDDLRVEGPVARVVEHEDGVDLGVRRGQGPRRRRVVRRQQRLEREDPRVRR